MSTMSQPDAWQNPTVRNYWLLCLAALLAVTLALIVRNLGAWSLLPILLGSLSLAGRWRSGPVLALLALGWVLASERIGLSPFDMLEFVLFRLAALLFGGRQQAIPVQMAYGLRGRLLFSDLLLCAGALAYGAAHYRLVGLLSHIFPTEPSKPSVRARAEDVEVRRSDTTVTQREILRLAWGVPACVLLAALAWFWLARQQAPVLRWPAAPWQEAAAPGELVGGGIDLELPAPVWRAMLLVWLLGAGLIVISALISHLGHRRMSLSEASLLLQDTLWRETCREQRLLHRWLARARLRRRRRGEKQ
jgi:hypothetical protein